MAEKKTKITDKIKEILTAKDLKKFESAMDQLVADRVSDKVKLVEEELKKKYSVMAEEYCQTEVAKMMKGEKAKLVEEYDVKLGSLEKKIVTKLDSFLEHVIVEQISEESIEKIAINEAMSPIVTGIKKLYKENFVEIESDGAKAIQEGVNKITDLETQLSEAIAKNVESEERLEKTATYLLISDKTASLTETQKQRVVEMFKGKHFDEVKDKIDTFIGMVKESKKTKKGGAKKKIDDVVTDKDCLKDKKKKVVKEDTEETYASMANRYLI